MSHEAHPPIQVADEHDNPLRGGSMDEAQTGGLWHRLARVMVYDKSLEKYLLQMVAPNPYYNGGLWNVTASGHVDEAESYRQTALRETEEEMGITGLSLVEVERYKTEKMKNNRMYRRHNVTYMAETDETPTVSPNEEVEKIVWVTRPELLAFDASVATDGLLHFINFLRQAR